MKKFFKKLFTQRADPTVESRGIYSDALSFNSTSGYSTNRALLLSAVYRAVDLISSSVAQLPLEPYKITSTGHKEVLRSHPSYWVLNREPNQRMSRYNFIKTLITSMLLKGNAYALIERDGAGNLTALRYLDSSWVVIVENPDGSVNYQVSGKGRVESKDIIHLVNFSYDGLHGISTLTHASNCINLSLNSESHASGFFKGGANLAGILQVHGVINDKQKAAIKAGWSQAFNPEFGDPNGIAILAGDMQYTPITISPADSQLLETRQFNIIDIARFFNVPPTKLYDLSAANYSTVEASSIDFLTGTLAPILENLELEFERKVFRGQDVDIRFDTTPLLRTDKAGMADYYSTLFQLGVVSPNEIRKGIDLPAIEDGDTHFVQVNLQTLSKHKLNEEVNEENEGD